MDRMLQVIEQSAECGKVSYKSPAQDVTFCNMKYFVLILAHVIVQYSSYLELSFPKRLVAR